MKIYILSFLDALAYLKTMVKINSCFQDFDKYKI